MKKKKPFYKTWWFIVIVAFIVLGAIGAFLDETETTPQTEPVEQTPESTIPEETIETSVYEYATNVEVTNAIDINQHVTVKLTVSEEANSGQAVLNIATQTFEFLQQEDIAGAKTVTILVLQNEKKITQFTVDKDKFLPNDTDPMANLVMQASEIEQMTEEVKEFGKTMEAW